MDEDDIACLQNSVQKPWEPAGAEEVGHHGPLHVNHPPPPHHGLHTQVFRQLKLLPCCDWVLKTANQKSEKVYIEDSQSHGTASARQRSEDFFEICIQDFQPHRILLLCSCFEYFKSEN